MEKKKIIYEEWRDTLKTSLPVLPEPEKVTSSILENIENFFIRKRKKNLLFPILRYSIAASLFLIVGITGYYLGTSANKEIIYNEIIAAQGEIKEYTLPDGTLVTLNSESKITIPSDFGKKSREIQMSGEIFFDVASNPQQPFIIKNKDLTINVLGTSFNVKSYDEDKNVKVTVSTGKVRVNIADPELQLVITPHEHLSINRQTGDISKTTVTENNYFCWKEGYMYFEKEPLQEVIKTINRKYNKTVELDCDNRVYLISGIHDNRSFEAIIEAICFTTGLQYLEKEDKIVLFQ